MSEQSITSIQIEKLGHQIAEIRVRALKNILSKLSNRLLCENVFSKSKEILFKLFQWFTFEPISNEEDVLKLIKQILESESGLTLIRHFGAKKFIDELKKIKLVAKLSSYTLIDGLIKSLKLHLDENERVKESSRVPPLLSDVPLSYRSNFSNFNSTGTTQKPLSKNINFSAQYSCTVTNDKIFKLDQDVGNEVKEPHETNSNLEFVYNELKIYLDWIPLSSSDRHVLSSVEESLQSPESSDLLHTCDFFKDVMLQDFPAEVFLQRRKIITHFLEYLKKTSSSRFKVGILQCLNKLISNLIIRIQQINDPNTLTSKKTEPTELVRPHYTPSFVSESSSSVQTNTDNIVIKNDQIKLPDFCCDVLWNCFELLKKFTSELEEKINKISNQAIVYNSFYVINKTIDLLNSCITSEIWYQKSNSFVNEILLRINITLVNYGDILEYLRIAMITNEEIKILRVIYLNLMCNCLKLLKIVTPANETELILPNSLKVAFVNNLSDALIAQLYPNVHNAVLNHVQTFQDSLNSTSVRKYKRTSSICKSITSAVNFLKHYKNLSIDSVIDLVDEGISSLEVHRNMNFIRKFILLCSHKKLDMSEKLLTKAQGAILKLLAYHDAEIQKETYKACHKIVIRSVGPIFNDSVNHYQIAFLLNSDIFTEIAMFGVNSKIKEIQKFAEEILIYILKCQVLVPTELWNEIIQVLIRSLPVLICHISENSSLGRTMLGVLDPDTAKSFFISEVITMKGNIGILYLSDGLAREEATSRIFWMFSAQNMSIDLIPRMSSLNIKNMSPVCQLKSRLDINSFYSKSQFYQSSSVLQMLEILKAQTTEPTMLKSALTQMSVMLEDPSLHNIFLDHNGLEIILLNMERALNEKVDQVYADSVIPAIAILKNLCLYSLRARNDLKNNIDAYFYILRGMFAFYSEKQARLDSCILLFYLVFGDHIIGSPKESNVSIPAFFSDRLSIPFDCNTHWKTSVHTIEPFGSTMLSDKWSLNSLKIHWNCEWYGAINTILTWEDLPYTTNDSKDFNEILMLTETDLNLLKISCVRFCLNTFLNELQLESRSSFVINKISSIICCLTLYHHHENLIKFDFDDFTKMPWEYQFGYFLNTPPADGGDILLLISIIKCLQILVLMYKESETCWIISYLKDETHWLPNLLQDNPGNDLNVKILHQELLYLIKCCVIEENKSILRRKVKNEEENESNWNYVVKMITKNLKGNQVEYFYNLAYLDSQLSCLVNITGNFNWENETKISKEIVSNLVCVILDLVTAFHEGKGQTAAISLMGIGIITHSVIILNHLLVELKRQKIKGWENYYLGEKFDDEKNCLKKIFSLRDCRNVLLRAAAFQLMAGLSLSPRAAEELNRELWNKNSSGLWQSILAILLHEEEAMIVKESAGMLMSNLTGHIASNNTKNALVSIYQMQTKNEKTVTCTSAIFLLIEEYNFFKEVYELLSHALETRIKIKKSSSGIIVHELSSKTSFKQWENVDNGIDSVISDSSTIRSKKEDINGVYVTPGLIRHLATFIQNLMVLDVEIVVPKLQKFGLLSLFFRCVRSPVMEINSVKSSTEYCDIMEMNIAIISFLTRTININHNCAYSLMNNRDCLHYLLGLLNTSIYYTYLPHLVYLRNRMWIEVFNLIKTIVNCSVYKNENNDNVASNTFENFHNIITSLIAEGDKKEFLETFSEAIMSETSLDLQNSALSSLTSLLQADVLSPSSSSISWGNLLDSTKTSRTELSEKEIMLHDLEKEESQKNNDSLWSDSKILKRTDVEKQKLLRNLYFRNEINDVKDDNNTGMESDKSSKIIEKGLGVAGGELCKILTYLYKLSKMDRKCSIRKINTIKSLTNLLFVSQEAKQQALDDSLLQLITFHLRDIHIKLSLESVDLIKNVAKKKKTAPIFKEVEGLIGLLTNFLHGSHKAKIMAAELNIADLTHKLWLWLSFHKRSLISGLKMLCTFTAGCEESCRTLPFTSALIGAGPKKTQNNSSILNEIYTLISREMDQISKTHNLEVLELCLNFLQNCCISSECRHTMSKSTIFQCIARLHPAITKGQKTWDKVEVLWMKFLQIFTSYSDGQLNIVKNQDTFSTILLLACDTRTQLSYEALIVLQNISFNSANRSKLLNCNDFLSLLYNKLSEGIFEEKNIIASMMWSLSANNQRAKLIMKSSGLSSLLKDSINHINMTSRSSDVDLSGLKRMRYVYTLLKEDCNELVQ